MTYKSGFTFRIKFRVSPTDRIQCDESRCVFIDPVNGRSLRLAAESDDVPITKSRTLTLTADGWDSETLAGMSGKRYEAALRIALVRLRIGADFGRETTNAVITNSGLSWFGRERGIERPLNDPFGLMVFETHPRPTFLYLSADAFRGVPAAQLEEVFLAALRRDVHINEREELAIDLFNTSMFANNVEAKFILHIMALEGLLELGDRSEEARRHVCRMIERTKCCDDLSHEEQQSLLGSLKWMNKESIRQAGYKLAEQSLGARNYDGVTAGRLFKECYDMRSQLAHGKNVDREKVRAKIGHLERLVSDILSAVLLDVGPNP